MGTYVSFISQKRSGYWIEIMLMTEGQDINNHFCPTCGTTLFRTGGSPSMKDHVGLRAGVLDDQTILDAPPAMEVYVERRPRVRQPHLFGVFRSRLRGHESGLCCRLAGRIQPSAPRSRAHNGI